MGLRRMYDEKLETIREHIVHMSTMATEMIEQAIEAVLTGDIDLANMVISRDDLVDALEETVIRETVLLVMQEAPVAGDLKFLTATLGVIGELEKVADDAVKLARRAKKIDGHFPDDMRSALGDLATNAKRSLAGAIRLYTSYDSNLAQEIITLDEKIDLQYSVARKRLILIMQQRPEEAENCVIAMGIFHALEHVADHAVAIAKRLRVHYESRSLSLEDES
ncbi:MAG: hypothetical protein K8R88_06705 [Armatimonadetes bacterium]|nr:hypothetical protein [Armatimonadota bacterium]